MSQTAHIINQVLPVILLLGLGVFIRRTRFVSESTIEELNKVVVNLALPAVLFLSFIEIELKSSYLLMVAVMSGLCVALFFAGRVFMRLAGINQPYTPFLTTGFEYGLIGISLFGSAYGIDNVGYIAVPDLGHEVFIWFFFLPMIMAQGGGRVSPGQLAAVFAKSPPIIGIVLGIGVNLMGFGGQLGSVPVAGAVVRALEFLGGMTIPLILIVVGYGIRIEREGLGDVLKVIAFRLVLFIPLAMALNAFFVRGVLDMPRAFEIGLFTLMIMPPPYGAIIFMRGGGPGDRRFVCNALAVGTVVSIALFTVYFSLNPSLG